MLPLSWRTFVIELMSLSDKTVQQVKDAMRVDDVVGEFVRLKKAGSTLKGLCPFHGEKTPSFVVSPAKGFYHCFGCQKSGDAITFLMEHNSLDFVESIKWLANRYNIEIIEEQRSQEAIEKRNHRDSLRLVIEAAEKHYITTMLEDELGRSVGLSYFKHRGFTDETIKNFGLGYAHDKRNDLVLTLTQAGYKQEHIQEAGLMTKSGADFLRGRVIFPIRDMTGKTVAFAGRAMVSDKGVPKYLNIGETELYKKSHVLYGLDLARAPIRKLDEAIVVEGYTDVISLHQHGVPNAVATSGTALTPGHVDLIRRFSDNVTFLFDGDKAGIKAAMRGMDVAVTAGANVRVVILDDGQDPDSFIQDVGLAAFEAFMSERKVTFVEFKASWLLKEAGTDPIKRSKAAREVMRSVALVDDSIMRQEYARFAAKLLDMNEQTLLAETQEERVKLLNQRQKDAAREQQRLQRERRRAAEQSGAAPPPPMPDDYQGMDAYDDYQEDDPREQLVERAAPSRHQMIEEAVIRLLVLWAEREMEDGITVKDYVLHQLDDLRDHFDDPICKLILLECYDRHSRVQPINEAYFRSHNSQDVIKLCAKLSAIKYNPSERNTYRHQKPILDNHYEETIKTIRRLRIKKIERLLKKTQLEFSELKSEDEKKQIKLIRRITKLQSILSALHLEDGTVVLPNR